ncbi:phosphate regulon transcriptional regulator PhoB [Aquisalimonas asiatica]|uniref:Phosphate regulon transcriptional regulatory protein PhoB n=1 Tax=Aquisalimonas asiatica TaxID=406100 RepID=A0A1H8RT20_9GAMM|nr:phosphate regulon transcriptional regulator PhoB [Aquisalimonas asiatica]SEO69510.1 two-component system, OmpR family, phosphate regulon response regulator PhoB [Aquisalimonas asiatica]
MTDKTVLIVDDEKPIREMVEFSLERSGFRVVEAGDAAEARVAITDHQPDLILLDWMLPDTSGPDLARALRRENMLGDIPIIMLTARTEEEDKVRGLEAGADDYVTKPFGPRELIARIQAVLRRTGGDEAEENLEIGPLRIEIAAHRVMVNDSPIHLGATEFRLLKFFAGHPDRVYTREQLLDRVWGPNVYVEERTVDVHIRRLRKALDGTGAERFVQTVRGAGYRFSTRE